jgi:UTP
VVLLTGPNVDVSDFAQSLWYPLWDAGFKLGHQVGTVEQILDVADGDLDTATSLLAARYVAGNTGLATELADGGRDQWMGSAEANLEALTTRVEERHGQHGEVAFRLEPELKEGRGGLRDVHSLAWAEATEPVLHASEAAGLSHAFEVLLTVRVELHRVTGGRSDRLLLELQDEVAERLSHGDADRLMATSQRAPPPSHGWVMAPTADSPSTPGQTLEVVDRQVQTRGGRARRWHHVG